MTSRITLVCNELPHRPGLLVTRIVRHEDGHWHPDSIEFASSDQRLAGGANARHHPRDDSQELDGDRRLASWVEAEEAKDYRSRHRIECKPCGLTATARQETLDRVCERWMADAPDGAGPLPLAVLSAMLRR